MKNKRRNKDAGQARQMNHLAQMATLFPGIWRKIESFRQLRGTPDVPDFPKECFLPMSAPATIVTCGGWRLTPERIRYTTRITPLAAWSVTKGIYRFDPTLFECVWETPLDGDLPVEILSYMPEWGIYIEIPGRVVAGAKLFGFYVTLAYDEQTGLKALHLLADSMAGLLPYRLPLVPDGLVKSVERALKSQEEVREYTREMAHLISLVLYICATTAEFRDARGSGRKPGEATGMTKAGRSGAESPTVWETGYRMGAALRIALKDYEKTLSPVGAIHASPRPHIRRAHFHHFWTGKKDSPDDRKLILKWIPPIPVKVERMDDLIPTIRTVSVRQNGELRDA